MNALLATIFSPLKETANSRNGQALDRLEVIATPTKKRRPERTPRKSVSFDMTPMKQVKHTPPRAGNTPVVRERSTLPNSRKRKAADVSSEDGENTEGEPAEPEPAPVGESTAPTEPAASMDEPAAETTEPAESPTETANTDAPETDTDGEFGFKQFLDHRWDGDSIEIQVEWENGQRTWEPETLLHDDAPQTLLDYWRQQPDGRPDNPRRPGFYEIHAIRKHSRDRKRLFVEWVGYGPTENTWEPRATVNDAAPDVLSDYWDSLPRRKRRRAR
ncbi:uncharacterized protein LMH87_008142 [Akanthomyces muscarius]|uniref:Chromo domain-containing protein n=1 Tax=Akanthomyces muscarius TaxID=2231603 RepID=A0A9W8QI53_AKAMU|nr:uncharacterized protein LMH87_008142 [Akanthomyces muscarius]KAJ4159234.1 hypothetical protein LMH87_008142 [Akanthomyces muscarius]